MTGSTLVKIEKAKEISVTLKFYSGKKALQLVLWNWFFEIYIFSKEDK